MAKRWLIFGLILTLAYCRGPEGLQTNNLSYLYNKQEVGLRPQFFIEPESKTLFRVFYQVETEQFLYTRPTDDSEYEARIRIEYRLLPSLESSTILDSGLVSFNHRVTQVQNEILKGNFAIELPAETTKAILFLKIYDINRGSSQANFQWIDNHNYHANSYFQLRDSADNFIFHPHIPRGLPFKVSHSVLDAKEMYVSYYRREFPLALPPYSLKEEDSFEIESDTTFIAPADQLLSFPQTGFYHFRMDTAQWSGLTVYNFYPEFPYVNNHQRMAEPLRYLTTQKEYTEMLALMDKPEELKEWIDDFWIRKGGSAERARSLVAAYYQRVEDANRNFSSYLEGWKTDRGIVYIIYGPPNAVYRSSSGEAWVYGNENSALSYYFNFIHLDNPFTDNDYSLERSNQYRYGWGQAIEAWRRGHIYNSKDIRREQDDYDQLQYRSRSPMWY